MGSDGVEVGADGPSSERICSRTQFETASYRCRICGTHIPSPRTRSSCSGEVYLSTKSTLCSKPEKGRHNGSMPDPLRIRDTVYLGGFDYLGLTEPRWGPLVLTDEAVTLTNVQSQNARRFPDIELCRTRAIASMEVTSEQVAKSKVGAALVFGVLGGLAAKGAADRATIVLHLKSGLTGYIMVKKRFAASVLGLLAPWRQAAAIPLGDPPKAQT